MSATIEQAPQGWRRIFRSTQGIRAGWSIGIFLLALALPAAGLFLVLRYGFHLKPPKTPLLTPWGLLRREALSSLFVLFASFVMARIEARRVASYGLAAPRWAAQLAAGGAGGFLCLSTLIGVLAAGGWWVFDGLALHGAGIVFYGAVWLLGFFGTGFSEEFLFRGYMLDRLGRSIGIWPAALLLSLLFGAAHIGNGGENVIGLAEVVVAGLVLCLMRRLSGALWLGIGFHTAWDWAQSYFYGTADSGFPAIDALLRSHAAGPANLSGGPVGPEGSVIAGPVMILGLGALLAACRAGGLLPRARPGLIADGV